MREYLLEILIVIAVTLIVSGVILIGPYYEAKTFNKFSKTKATYWDALVSDLRVVPDK